MDETRTKEVLDFLLSSYRAKLAIQNGGENCPFDFHQFLTTYRGKYESWGALKTTMKNNLEPLMQEGIFDSIIPYLSSSINQSTKDDPFYAANSIISADLTTLSPSKLSKQNAKRSSEPREILFLDDKIEIIIHVCDEAKSVRQDFKCPQGILVKEMGYFSKVTVKGQKLRDMDISVHCDITIFDWLMRWVKQKANLVEEGQLTQLQLDASNVIGLMVSAEFLQMPSLTTECVQFTAENIEQVIQTSPNLGCLNEQLTNRIGKYFNNLEMEEKIGKIDKNDRITSRLYTQFVISLNDQIDPEIVKGGIGGSRGHYASTSTLFKCHHCDRLLTNDIAYQIPCTTMRLDCGGRIYACHTKDPNWSLTNYIRELKRELKTWRRAYWRLWGTVHYLQCTTCQLWFPLKELSYCRYHPKPPKLQVHVNSTTGEIQERNLEDPDQSSPEKKGQPSKLVVKQEECINPFRRQRELLKETNAEEAVLGTINCAFGAHPCCRKAGYKYFPLPQTNGCQFRDHTPNMTKNQPNLSEILHRLALFRDLILINPKDRDRYIDGRSSFLEDPIEWGGIPDLTPLKQMPSSTFSTPMLSLLRLPVPKPSDNRSHYRNNSSSSDSSSTSSNNSLSDTEDAATGTGTGTGNDATGTASTPSYSLRSSSHGIHPHPQGPEFWSWNADFTTRYNQDMQREKEEKLMSDLETLLSQRVSLEGNSLTSNTAMRYTYLSRRVPKHMGGSFLRLEEKWRQEHGSKTNAPSKSAK